MNWDDMPLNKETEWNLKQIDKKYIDISRRKIISETMWCYTSEQFRKIYRGKECLKENNEWEWKEKVEMKKQWI